MYLPAAVHCRLCMCVGTIGAITKIPRSIPFGLSTKIEVMWHHTDWSDCFAGDRVEDGAVHELQIVHSLVHPLRVLDEEVAADLHCLDVLDLLLCDSSITWVLVMLCLRRLGGMCRLLAAALNDGISRRKNDDVTYTAAPCGGLQ